MLSSWPSPKIPSPSPATGRALLVVQKHLGADSLDTVEIIMAIEEAFSLEIPESEQEKIRTVGDAISYIEKHAKA